MVWHTPSRVAAIASSSPLDISAPVTTVVCRISALTPLHHHRVADLGDRPAAVGRVEAGHGQRPRCETAAPAALGGGLPSATTPRARLQVPEQQHLLGEPGG
jgi:hypothetical protein